MERRASGDSGGAGRRGPIGGVGGQFGWLLVEIFNVRLCPDTKLLTQLCSLLTTPTKYVRTLHRL